MHDLFGALEALQFGNLVKLRQTLHIAALWMGISFLSWSLPPLTCFLIQLKLSGNMIKVVTWIPLPSQPHSFLGLLAVSGGLGRGEGSNRADKRFSKKGKTFKMMDEHAVCVCTEVCVHVNMRWGRRQTYHN